MLHNLLPKGRKDQMKIEYYTRLGTASALLTATALILGVFALIPTYLNLTSEVATLTQEVEHHSTNAEESKALAAEVRESAEVLRFLEHKLKNTRLTDILEAALEVRPEGVVITGFAYDRKTGQLTVEGVADVRELVVTYTKDLELHEMFTKVPLPVSDLARQTNVPFNLQITVGERDEHSI